MNVSKFVHAPLGATICWIHCCANTHCGHALNMRSWFDSNILLKQDMLNVLNHVDSYLKLAESCNFRIKVNINCRVCRNLSNNVRYGPKLLGNTLSYWSTKSWTIIWRYSGMLEKNVNHKMPVQINWSRKSTNTHYPLSFSIFNWMRPKTLFICLIFWSFLTFISDLR